MQFAHTEEQRLIRESARSFLASRAGAAQLRAALEQPGAYDAQLWREMASEMGWAGLAIAAEHGGAGLGGERALGLPREPRK
jgi:alkylation response protein AidB-like acyl-CoA dehydrogenase